MKKLALPLYSGSSAPENYSKEFNAGLWYDKFCNQWVKKGEIWSLEAGENASVAGKNRWINQINEKKIGSHTLVQEFVDRLGCMVGALQGEVRCFTTGWRFVTGLGREHPVENGFAWHHVLGVPYLPGSSVKGVVRAWAEQWVGVNNDDALRVFGSADTAPEKREKSIGSVIFFDALPVGPVKVQADVMTPHYVHYYQSQGATQPPGDWSEPVPIPFLTVAPDQTFLFSIAPRRPDSQEDRHYCMLALEWLEEALAGIGAGAKTATGYGRFMRKQELEKELLGQWASQQLEERRGENLAGESDALPAEPSSSILAEMMSDGYYSDPDRFMHALTTKWLSKMQSAETETSCRREIAGLLAEWYRKERPDQWKKPNKKNASKIAAIKAAMEIN